jgi:hypothetical protein
MKKIVYQMMLVASMATLTACSSDDPFDTTNNNVFNPGGTEIGGGNGSSSAGSGELLSFSVNLDRESTEPASTVAAYYPEAEDDITTQTFATQIAIDMTNPVAKTENGVEITVSEGHVTANHGSTEGICYVVTGTTSNGSLTIDGKTNFELNLNSVDITNPTSTALDIESKKASYIVLTGTNKLTDGTTEDHKSTLYGKGKLLLSGTGSLNVYGTYNNGIHTKSYVVIDKGVNLYVNTTINHGIKASDAVVINGGIINIESSGEGAKGINCEKDIVINGGRTNVICTGNGEWDTEDLETKAATCIKCDSIMTIKGGEINVKATGSGGKGLKADWEAYISGGKIRVITTGGLYYSNGTQESHNYTGNTDNLDDAYTSSPKGIKVGTKNEHGVLQINGGDLMVRTSGTNGEGIESKGTLDITDGTVMVSAYDDAINSSGDLTISGGYVVAVGTNNDGIDSNGNMYLKGGTLIAMGAGGAEAGIDINEQKKLYISGGNIFGIGGRFDGSLGSTSQGIVTTSGSVTANSTVTITSGSTTLASFAMPPYSYNNGTIVVSAPDMKSGSSYTLNLGSQSVSVTASNTISNSGMGGGPGGNNRPGGW